MSNSLRCLLGRTVRRLARSPMLAALLALLLIACLLAWRASQTEGGGHPDGRRIDDAHDAQRQANFRHPPHAAIPTVPPAPPPTTPPTPTPLSLDIPKRFHHYFGDSVSIPAKLTQSLNSWANNHKDYDVYFWDSRYLEKRLFPGLPRFQRYARCHRLERHTVARLLILLNFGGVLVDPDLMSLRDLSGFLGGSSCVISQERPEVAALVYGLDGILPSLRFAACRPGHPFLGLFLDKFCDLVAARSRITIASSSIVSRSSSSSISGSSLATAAAVRAAFDAAVSDYDDDCASRVCDYRDRVVLADAGVFLPVVTEPLHAQLMSTCAEKTASILSEPQRLACKSLTDPANRNLPGVIALAMSISAASPEDTRSVPLDRIGPNVGRRATANFHLSSAET